MTFSTTTLIICVLLMVFGIVSCIMNPLFRDVTRKDKEADDADDTRLSKEPGKVTIVVSAIGNCSHLEDTLCALLAQKYEPGFELIVTGDKDNPQIDRALGKIGDKINAHFTFVPHKPIFMSKPKLAVLLGVKAAHSEWIILLDANATPMSDLWLLDMARGMRTDTNLIVTYGNYDKCASRLARFRRLRTAAYVFRCATLGTAFKACGKCIAFRGREFVEGDGYRGNLEYANGEYDFIINKFAKNGSTGISYGKEAGVMEWDASKKDIVKEELSELHIWRGLRGHASMLFLYRADIALFCLNGLLQAVAMAYAVIFAEWVVLAVAATMTVITFMWRSVTAHKVMARYGEYYIPAWTTVFLEMFLPLHDLVTRLRYWHSDKYDFITHKL